jgi:hypothetical protein
MLTSIDPGSHIGSHLSLIGALCVSNTEGLDIAVSFVHGGYQVSLGQRNLRLPIASDEARDAIEDQCPNLSPRFAELLSTLLSHRSWAGTSANRYPMY